MLVNDRSTHTAHHPGVAPADSAPDDATGADPAHSDVPHEDMPHEDTPHADAPHTSVPLLEISGAHDRDIPPTNSAHCVAGVADATLAIVALAPISDTQLPRTQLPRILADESQLKYHSFQWRLSMSARLC